MLASCRIPASVPSEKSLNRARLMVSMTLHLKVHLNNLERALASARRAPLRRLPRVSRAPIAFVNRLAGSAGMTNEWRGPPARGFCDGVNGRLTDGIDLERRCLPVFVPQ